jgi:hypothetical protein
MLILSQAFSRPLRRGEALLAILVWAATAVNPPFVFHVSVVTPLLVLGLMVRVYDNPRVQKGVYEPKQYNL